MLKDILVYSSIGDICEFYPEWKHERCFHVYNHYGKLRDKAHAIKQSCDIFTHKSGTKFNLFSKLYSRLPKFDYYVLLDDDLNITGDEIVSIVENMKKHGYGVGSPSHSLSGRISWRVMETRDNGASRESEFVEMTVVIFSRNELEKFLAAYVPYRDLMVGWGIDHIIHSVCSKPFVIYDNISVINPTNEQKGIEKREIMTYLGGRDGRQLWHSVLNDKNNNFVEYIEA